MKFKGFLETNDSRSLISESCSVKNSGSANSSPCCRRRPTELLAVSPAMDLGSNNLVGHSSDNFLATEVPSLEFNFRSGWMTYMVSTVPEHGEG